MKQQAKLDIAYTVETPEGIDIQVELAGPIIRTLAFSIDFSIRIGAMLILLIVSSLLGSKIGGAVYLLIYFLVEWFYPVVFEVFRHGQTPGKKIMGISVVNDDLTPVTFSASFVRNLLRAADFLPALYCFGLISLCASRNFQRLGDIAAGTVVIYKELKAEKQTPPDAHPLSPQFELSDSEQNAIVEFSLRHESLSQGRQKELADIIKPLFIDENERSNQISIVDNIKGTGAWLLGARSK